MILHIVNKSPYDNNSLQDCLQNIFDGDSIILIEDAVVAALNASPVLEKLSGKTVYVLEADLEARGLKNRVVDTVNLATDKDFVALTVSHSSTMSWY